VSGSAEGSADVHSAAAGTQSPVLIDDVPHAGPKAIFRRFWPYTRPFRTRLWITVALVAIGPMFDTAGIWMFKVFIDDVLTPENFGLFPVIAALYVGITLAGGAVSYTSDYLSAWISEKFMLDLRTSVFAHLHRLSVGFFERRPLGDVLSRLTGDIATIEQTVVSGLVTSLSCMFTILLYAGAVFYLNWQLGLVAMIAAPLFLVVTRSFGGPIKAASRERRRRMGAITTVAEESFGNAALVQAYDQQAAETARFHEEGVGCFTAQMVSTRLRAVFSPLIALLEALGVLLVLGLGMWELAQHRITLGGLLVFVVYLTELYSPIRGIGRLSNSVYAASASAERIMELQDLTPLVADPAQPRRIGRAAGILDVHDVSLTYPGAPRPSLSGVDFTVGRGQKLALVGASGAGKSTLAKLLLRLYDPDSGAIRLDGIDLRELALTDLRNTMAAVLQETLVFDATVAENIAWGKPGADQAEIVAAATAADAHEFITALPDGYATRVGQRGRLLSGGQRQRVAIARAMIRDAPVLLLDEPTTGLDAESAERVLAPLQRLMSGRTTVLISHNLLTATNADQILFLDGGRVTGAGTHHELLATHPGYAHLYRLHQGGNDVPASPRPVLLQAGDRRPSPVPRRPEPPPAAPPDPVPTPDDRLRTPS
jgi:ABC-type multidrug transport system fused ATPase/permease subunit